MCGVCGAYLGRCGGKNDHKYSVLFMFFRFRIRNNILFVKFLGGARGENFYTKSLESVAFQEKVLHAEVAKDPQRAQRVFLSRTSSYDLSRGSRERLDYRFIEEMGKKNGALYDKVIRGYTTSSPSKGSIVPHEAENQEKTESKGRSQDFTFSYINR